MVAIQVGDAIQHLLTALGEACGGDVGPKQTMMGKAIKGATAKFTRNDGPESRSLVVAGGGVLILLSGEEQPEAARVVDGVIDLAMSTAKIVNLDAAGEVEVRRKQVDGGMGRKIVFSVPDDKAELFAQEIDRYAQMIRRSGELKEQCHTGVTFSATTIDRITGQTETGEIKPSSVRTSLWLNFPKANAAETNAIVKPYFNLTLRGVPDKLVERLAPLMGKQLSDFSPSGKHHSRDLKDTFTEGRTVTLPLNAPYIDAIMQEISSYVATQYRLNRPSRKPPSGKRLLPEASDKPSGASIS